ncbi:unnamed protein product [Ranitomeya imitator]|uniref:Uncharacterized protein n=1 Tax=Ranitomeya imitator TaxID=111125 RepID=A0ABN9LZV5_9NEOB|nr:unnamed protein product [Ranitomeya imitator]
MMSSVLSTLSFRKQEVKKEDMADRHSGILDSRELWKERTAQEQGIISPVSLAPADVGTLTPRLIKYPYIRCQDENPIPLLMHPMILFALAAAAWHWLLQDIVPVYQIKGISKLFKLCLPKVQCFCDSLTSPPSERQHMFVRWHKQRKFQRTLEEELSILIKMEKAIKPSLKSVDKYHLDKPEGYWNIPDVKQAMIDYMFFGMIQRSPETPAPINCELTSWSNWTECDPCTNQKFRSRSIVKFGQFGGSRCLSSLGEYQRCKSDHQCAGSVLDCGKRL